MIFIKLHSNLPRIERLCVQSTWPSYLDSRSRSHDHSHLGAIFIKLHPNVSLNEMMCRTYDSARQTKGKGHTSSSCDLPFILFPLHISWTLWTVFIKHHSNVPLSKLVSRTHETQLRRLKVKVPIQGHGFHPWIWWPLHISWRSR